MADTPVIYVLDDDASVVKSLSRVLAGENFTVKAFTSAADFLQDHDPALPGCLLLDMVMSEIDGIEVQRRLAEIGCKRPIIFFSGRSNIPQCATAMKGGAIDFLQKPVEAEQLLSAISTAISRDQEARERARRFARFERLTLREREVLDAVVQGLLNKQIAERLGIVEKTVKVHRAHAMRKIGARSIAEIVRLVQSSGWRGRPEADHNE